MNLSLDVAAIGVIGPGLPDWPSLRAVLRGEQPYVPAPAVVPPVQQLPAAERRRIGQSVRLALAVATQAFAASTLRAADTASVFTSSGADGDNCHALCEALAQPDPMVSPTRFTNSVHNAPAGYWGIAERAMAPSTSLCAYDASFGAGLLEAATQVIADARDVALISYDVPYPEPLHGVRPIAAPFGVALLLQPAGSASALARLRIEGLADDASDTVAEPALQALARGVPTACALPLLAAIAQGRAARVALAYLPGCSLALQVAP